MRDTLREATGEPVNSIMVTNQYLNRYASIDHHYNKPADITSGTSIWTVSLGATRFYELVDDCRANKS